MDMRLVLPSWPRDGKVHGYRPKLVNIKTGEELDCATDNRLNMPLNGLVTVTVEIAVQDVVIGEAAK